MTKPINNSVNFKPVTKQEPSVNTVQEATLPINVVKMSIYLNGAIEGRSGKNSSVVEFTDVNFNHKLDKGDIVSYADKKGVQKKSAIVEEKDNDLSQASATEIILEDGSVVKASKQNLFKAGSLLNLMENNITSDGKTLLINTKMGPHEMYKAVNRLTHDCDRINQKDGITFGKLVDKVKDEPENTQYTQKAPNAYIKDKTQQQLIQDKPTLCLFNIAGVKKFIIKPAAQELVKPLTSTDLDDPNWTSGLCVGLYSREDNKQ